MATRQAIQAESWRTVRAALLHLGVEIVTEHDLRIVFCRGAVLLATLRKTRVVPRAVQIEIPATLRIDEAKYLSAVGRVPLPSESLTLVDNLHVHASTTLPPATAIGAVRQPRRPKERTHARLRETSQS